MLWYEAANTPDHEPVPMSAGEIKAKLAWIGMVYERRSGRVCAGRFPTSY
jgi:hypothetical protein